MIVSLVNQKGGVGKSTITINLARAIQSEDVKVAVIDCDPQGTTTTWSKINKEQNGGYFPVHKYDIKDLPDKLEEFKDYDVVIIDGAPRLEELAVEIVKVSDIIVIPFTPSPNDVWATLSFVDLVEERLKVKPELKAMLLVNKIKTNTTIQNKAVAALSDLKIPILKTRIVDRVIYAESMLSGTAAVDNCKKSKHEINLVKEEIIEIYKKG